MKPEEKGQKVNKKQHNFKNAVQKKKKCWRQKTLGNIFATQMTDMELTSLS